MEPRRFSRKTKWTIAGAGGGGGGGSLLILTDNSGRHLHVPVDYPGDQESIAWAQEVADLLNLAEEWAPKLAETAAAMQHAADTITALKAENEAYRSAQKKPLEP